MDITILERKIKMNNAYINILHRLCDSYKKYFRYIWVMFSLLGCYMMSYIEISYNAENKTELIYLCIFVIYLLWYTYPKPKNEYLYSIPLFLYIIGYYVIHWSSICEVTKVFWHGIFG